MLHRRSPALCISELKQTIQPKQNPQALPLEWRKKMVKRPDILSPRVLVLAVVISVIYIFSLRGSAPADFTRLPRCLFLPQFLATIPAVDYWNLHRVSMPLFYAAAVALSFLPSLIYARILIGFVNLLKTEHNAQQ
jgi:hypothetical protein